MPTHPSDDLKVYKALLDHGIDLVTLIDDKGYVTYQSPVVEEQFGFTPEEMLGKHIYDFLHPDDVETAANAFSSSMAGKGAGRIVVRFRDKEDNWHKLEVVGRVHENQGRKSMILNARDVTDHQAMLEKLKRSEQLLHAAFNSTGTICSITDLDTGEYIEVNDAWVNTTGWQREEIIGLTSLDINIWGSPEYRQRLTDKLREEGKLKQFPATVHTKTGEQRSILLDAEALTIGDSKRLFISCVDITERERMEAQLRQSQRMEAVGQLTGGIAHDLNNMLTVVLGQIDLSTNKDFDKAAYQEALATIRRATERGSELIQQLMIFSRRQTLKPQVINVAETINNMITLLEGSLSGEININIRADNIEWPCYLDEGLLENAILNLAINARDAMPTGGGNLDIIIEQTVLDELTARRHEVAMGDYVKIRVIDDGKGMEASAVANAFEPFFTTKPIGQGTGLGLSMVFGFVRQSGGYIEISSAPRRGTTITILLPRTTEEMPGSEQDERELNQLQGKTVLVIEDNEELRTVVRLLLESFGCEVIECEGDRVDIPGDAIDLILSDVILPGAAQGPDLVAETKQKHPNASVLYMSGYPRERLTQGGLITEEISLLKKPFSRDELQQKLSDVLNQRASLS